MELVNPSSFLEENNARMLYVGFCKSASEIWFPFCMVSNPGADAQLDTLFVSYSYQEMVRMVQDCASEIPQVVQTFVQLLMPEEIRNLVDCYAIQHLALVVPETAGEGCGCGCGCGCG